MYQLPELAKAMRNDDLRAAEHRQLCARAYAARRNGARRGIVRLAGLHLRLAATSLRHAAQAF